MEKSYLINMMFNDVVFRGRNKAYGAYWLRKIYGRHIAIAAISAIAIFLGAFVGPLVQHMLFGKPIKYEKPTYSIYKPIDIVLPLPPKVEKPKPEQLPPTEKVKQQAKTVAYTETKIVPDDTKIETIELASQEELKDAHIGTKTIDGVKPAVPATEITETPPTGLDNATGSNTAVFLHVEKMPEFRGGEEAMLRYLGKNLKYPASAQQYNIEGLVVVTFVVATNGEIQDIQVLKGLGYGTEEKAVRVIEKMPPWSPGLQNGRAVPVRYTSPIRFNLK